MRLSAGSWMIFYVASERYGLDWEACFLQRWSVGARLSHSRWNLDHHIIVYLVITACSQTSMVLHSTAQNKHIMQVSCGGGHRSYGTSSINQVSTYWFVHAYAVCKLVFDCWWFILQMTSERRSVMVFIKQSLLCFREMDLHAYFTQPVIQVDTVELCPTPHIHAQWQ